MIASTIGTRANRYKINLPAIVLLQFSGTHGHAGDAA